LVIDLLAAVFFLGMLASGYIMRYPLPPGAHADYYLWGLNRFQWGDLHYWISIGLLGILLVHVALHWQWVASVIGRRFRLAGSGGVPRWGSAVISIALVLGALCLFAWLAHISVRELPDPFQPPRAMVTASRPDVSATQKSHLGQEKSQVDFWKDVYPIFKASCLSCHGPQRARGDFRVDRREDFFGAGDKEPLVRPGKSGDSLLIKIVSGLQPNMPSAKSHKLSEPEISVLKGWIDAGAPWPVISPRE